MVAMINRIALQRSSKSPNSELFASDEQFYEEAGERHRLAAETLSATSALLVEARIHAWLACECILKALFCIARHASGASRSPFSLPTTGKRLGHDLKAIAKTLIDECEGIATDLDFGIFVTKLPAGTGWIEERYGQTSEAESLREETRKILDHLEKVQKNIGKDLYGR